MLGPHSREQPASQAIARPAGPPPWLGDGELQHVVPSWDLRTLYASHDLGDRVTPFDPTTGTPGTPIPITDPYNGYFTPDGRTAVFTCEFAGRVDVVDVAAHRLLRMIEALRHEPGRYSLGHTGITR